MMKKLLLTSALLASMTGPLAASETVSTQAAKIYSLDDIHYVPSPANPKISTAVLFGDPSKAGPYALRVRFEKGLKVEPHYHKDALKIVTLVEGVLHFAYGDKFDEAALKPHMPGYIWTEANGQGHFARTKETHAIIEIHGIGPTTRFNFDQ